VPDNAIVSLPVSGWSGPLDPARSHAAIGALEAGQVVLLPGLAFETLAEESVLLSSSLLKGDSKNISLDPATGRVGGEAAHSALLAAMLGRFRRSADSLLRSLLAPYADALRPARTSFRPAKLAGREYSPRQDDRRLHVDAFPSRTTGGDRIPRLFSVLPQANAPREWRLGEAFETAAARLLPALPTPAPRRARLYALMGLTKGVRTPYDQMMLGLHDRMKLDSEYQRTASFTTRAFPPGSTWMCFTDQVPHAALSAI